MFYVDLELGGQKKLKGRVFLNIINVRLLLAVVRIDGLPINAYSSQKQPDHFDKSCRQKNIVRKIVDG